MMLASSQRPHSPDLLALDCVDCVLLGLLGVAALVAVQHALDTSRGVLHLHVYWLHDQ